MHEIRATVSPDCADEAVRLAREAGIESVTVTEVFVRGPDQRRQSLSVETSTPKAKAFIEAFLASPRLASAECTITSRELRAVLDGTPFKEITRPWSEPYPDVIQDLWQLSHVNASYIGRALGGAILLATGVIDNDPIPIVVAALFLPFLSQVLAVSFGLWSRDWRLLLHGLRAVLTSAALALAAGAAVGWIEGGPIRFEGFKGPLPSFLISGVIGAAAGLSVADDTGRRYLIGVAAAVQLAVFPAWFGAALATGLPAASITASRLESFLVNFATIAVAALLAYAGLHLKGGGSLSPPATRR